MLALGKAKMQLCSHAYGGSHAKHAGVLFIMKDFVSGGGQELTTLQKRSVNTSKWYSDSYRKCQPHTFGVICIFFSLLLGKR